MTWAELLALSLRDSGIVGTGQTAMAEDINDAKTRANMMIGQWNRRRWLVYHLVDTFCTCDGSLFYEVGPGMALDVARPDKIEAAFTRQTVQTQPNRIDYPLTIIPSYEDYSLIALKRLSAGPAQYLFYDSGYPTGRAYPYPLMNSQFELHILTKSVLDSIPADLTAEMMLPPEYQEAVYTNLMVRNRMAYQLPADRMLNGLAAASLATIRSSNFQIGTLRMPAAVLNTGGGLYSIFSDRSSGSGL